MSHLKSSQEHALALLKQQVPGFDSTTPIFDSEEISRLSGIVGHVEAEAALYCNAALGNHAITEKARDLICLLVDNPNINVNVDSQNPNSNHKDTDTDTEEALRNLRKLDCLKALGALMNAHHVHLKNDLGTTVPEIDRLIEAALSVPECVGAKIVGSGGGGCMVALVVNGVNGRGSGSAHAAEVLMQAGAQSAFVINDLSAGPVVRVMHDV